MTLPTDPAARKAVPIYSGFIKYFPRAICAVAELSRIGNDQHNPGQPLHWARAKSRDELDALMRHLVDDAMGVPTDTDNVLHATKLAWRAMANLEKALEAQECQPVNVEAAEQLEQVPVEVPQACYSVRPPADGRFWLDHDGKGPPAGLKHNKAVLVCRRSGGIARALADSFVWFHTDHPADIMWWRHAD